MRRRILPNRSDPGGCTLRLTHQERSLLANLPKEVDDLLAALASTTEGSGSPGSEGATSGQHAESELGSLEGVPAVPPSLRRLFPPAYTRDDDAERSYAEVTRPALLEHHRQALRTLSETASAKSLDAEQVQEWLTALNDVRLVLGTVLDIREDSEPPVGRMPEQLLYYYYLSGLEAEMVDHLALSLPPPMPGADDEVPEDPWGEPLGGLRWDGTPRPADGP